MIFGLSLLASAVIFAQTPATTPAAPPASEPASPAKENASAYRAELTGLTEQNAVAVRKALEAIPNVAKVTVMPKGGYARLDVKNVETKLFRKNVEDALATAQVPGVAMGKKFFPLAAPK